MQKPSKRRRKAPLYFPPVPLAEVVTTTGKHSKIISEIFSDLQILDNHCALKIALAEVGEKKADLRSALHRAARKKHMALATASDKEHLYVFRPQPKPQPGR
ncbi:MAG: hypothetical protein ACE14M_07165 [Terriglobales bacterium]